MADTRQSPRFPDSEVKQYEGLLLFYKFWQLKGFFFTIGDGLSMPHIMIKIMFPLLLL